MWNTIIRVSVLETLIRTTATIAFGLKTVIIVTVVRGRVGLIV